MISIRPVLLFLIIVLALGACSTVNQVSRTRELAESADAPYGKLLVIALFDSFDSRRYLEQEVVTNLSELGAEAIASTSMMDSKTPVTRQTFVAMIEEIGADAVMVTQLVNLESEATVKDMRPETTVNYWPTYYYNVFQVEVTEYVEPQGVAFDYSLVLMTELISVRQREPVWAIQSSSKIALDAETTRDYSIYVDEADAITSYLLRDGLIAELP